MDSAIVHLEQSVQEADGKLDMIAWKIDAFEKEFEDPESEISVLRLLRSVHQVTKDYQNLRQEILEVQQLQKQLSDSLKAQLSQKTDKNKKICERSHGIFLNGVTEFHDHKVASCSHKKRFSSNLKQVDYLLNVITLYEKLL